MIKNILSVIVVSVSLLSSCGNAINDELSETEKVILQINSTQNDGFRSVNSFGSVIGTNFSTSGRIRIQSTGSEGYFISGSKTDINGRDNLWISYLDKNAVIKWSALLESLSTNDRIIRMEVMDRDNILIFADRYYTEPGSGSDYDTDIIIVKVNSISGIVWQKCFGNAEKNRIFGTVLTTDGGFLATGITIEQKNSGTVFKPYVMRADSHGNMIWKKDYKNFFDKVTPSEIISLGNDEYLFSGVATNPSNNKLSGFYCRIDGRAAGVSNGIQFGGGKPLKTKYYKTANNNIAMIGNISNSANIVSVLGLAGSASAAKFCINIIDKESLRIMSRKNYLFSDFNLQGRIVIGNSNEFYVAGMLRPNSGNGLYFISFDMSGSLKELRTKYYDDNLYNFFNTEFNIFYESTDLAFISRLNNHAGNTDLFIDKFISSSKNMINMSSAFTSGVINKAVTASDDNDVVEEDLEVEAEDSLINDNGNPGLVLNRI